MKAAQGAVREGVEVEGMGAIGSDHAYAPTACISDDARRDGCAFIKERFGDAYLPEKAPNL